MIAPSPFDTEPTRRIGARFSQKTAVIVAVRMQSGRYIAAPFDADGWQTSPSQYVGFVGDRMADVDAEVRHAFPGVTDIVGPR